VGDVGVSDGAVSIGVECVEGDFGIVAAVAGDDGGLVGECVDDLGVGVRSLEL
jgi:hypothetical protein